MHRASWPSPEELPTGGDPELLAAAAGVLGAARKAKSTAQVTMKTPVARLRLTGPAELVDRVRAAQADLVNAALVEALELEQGAEEAVEVTLGEPPAKR